MRMARVVARVVARKTDTVEGPPGLQVAWCSWAEDMPWKGGLAFESEIRKYHES